MVASSVILAIISKIIPAPWLQGGSVTLASAVPVIIASVMFGTKWGLLTSVTYAVIQMIMGFYPPPTQSIVNFLLVIFLDYILAFGVFGTASIFYKKNKPYTMALSGFLVTFLRYLCHIFSGILIWGVYAEEGQSVLAYSLIYNGSYMIPEIIITTVVCFLISKNKSFLKFINNN